MALGISLAGLALAVAALINVSNPSLGSNTVVVAACDTNGITATPSFSYSAATGGYVVDSVLLGGLQNGCRQNDISVSLVGSGGVLATTALADVPIASFTQIAPNNQELSVAFTSASPRVGADQVTAIHVAISN